MKKIEDERIIEGKRRINSNAFGICFLGLWAILIFRQFVLLQDISEYIDIFLLTMGISLYVTVNSVVKGFYLTYRSKETRKKINLLSALVGSTVFIIVQIFVVNFDFTNWMDIAKLIMSALMFFFIWITCQGILFKISDDKSNEDIE